MAADDLLTEFHLTPDGWIKRTERLFGKIDGEEVRRPDNAVETWTERVYQSSIYSKDESITHNVPWHDGNIEPEKRRALRAKFKMPFTREPEQFLEK